MMKIPGGNWGIAIIGLWSTKLKNHLIRRDMARLEVVDDLVDLLSKFQKPYCNLMEMDGSRCDFHMYF